MSHKRVVITGYGAVCSLGKNIEEIWNSVLNYKMGYSKTPYQDETVAAKFFGKIHFSPDTSAISKRIIKNLPRFAKFGMIAAHEAIYNAFPDIKDLDYYSPFDRGVIFGTGWGGLDSTIDNNDLYVASGIASPLSTIFSMHSVCTASISMNWNFRGYQNTPVAACATGSISIGDAYDKIKSGQVNMMLAGGGESITGSFNVWSVDILGALSKEQDEANKACCPFSKDRSGFILSEGAAVVCLEEYSHAIKRGAKILGEVVGYANYSDAYDITAPAEDLMGRIKSIKVAIDVAGIQKEDIDYINAHGTSTYLNDLNETNSVKAALDKHAYRIPMSSTKSYTGHLIAASGAIETIFCLKSLESNIVPATINLNNSDPQCDLDYVPNHHRTLGKIDHILNINYGFGGANSALVIKRAS
ncbi:3-oxoacyl-(acyl-carrier-protein) synthase (FabB) (PDB:2UV8) (PUBMED:21652641) [Commensalibacter communis]|uniref:beta-ketoacyl-[acyl-carrier-protein] synthase family protein n=1 Tax=Commensalibacter communis TaxID=2972786 RepID=UPI0022FFAB82|nr:beta-ketoacyl-[acyl-carrier-protein] synthase family protein [Commensalibacter communis]CAI3954222.1 3-oxoacyl-(acyl-carrier-protein) synthase (FabB) (PDB:2UV8) (PUBMED:21652641) [Commensalibacter communis]CAI3954996.1 3-oxoacyl-(acyl-carrier-protein) synthase (FabB) (PDB:2UV8) (PUBMED:21652641) [Commensalibacter communis]